MNRDVRLETFRITRDGRREDDIHRRRLRHRLTMVFRGEEEPRARARGGEAQARVEGHNLHHDLAPLLPHAPGDVAQGRRVR